VVGPVLVAHIAFTSPWGARFQTALSIYLALQSACGRYSLRRSVQATRADGQDAATPSLM